MVRNESEFVRHMECPCGTSSDALALYTDGHSYCFRCMRSFNPDKTAKDVSDHLHVKPDGRKAMKDLLSVDEFKELKKRKISHDTCRKYGYFHTKDKGKTVQVAPYHDSKGKVVAQKIRAPGKKFYALGNFSDATLFGQQLFAEGGKRIVVTEGEIDALSVYEAMPTWPSVSIGTGAAGSTKAVRDNVEYLESFDKVIFMFDEDEAGKSAAQSCADLLSPGKSHIASLSRKDANEMLQHGEARELVSAIFSAKQYRPDGVINGSDTWDDVTKPVVPGIDYPFAGLNEKTFGIRPGELITICGGSGIGKSQFVSEISYDLAINHNENIGYIALEEAVGRSARRFMAIDLDKPIHLPNVDVTQDQLKSAFENTMGTGRIWFYDHWGSLDSDNLLSRMRYLVKSCGCKFLVLDHLSIVISGMGLEGDERRMLDRCITMLRSFAEETKCGLLIVSHLRRPALGKSHEEGLMPSLTDLRSSHSIAQLSDLVLALGRNSQSDDVDERNTTFVRILKNRYSGMTGEGCALRYSSDTGRLSETDAVFTDEGEF